MEQAVPHMLLIFKTEPPGPLLLARLSQYDADLVPSQKFDFKIGPPNLRRYDAILVYTPGNLRSGRYLCDRLRGLASTPILLIAPIKDADEACRALQESVDVLLPPEIDPAIVAGHIASLVRFQRKHLSVRNEADINHLHLYQDEDLEIDLMRRTVKVQGRSVHLTPTEFRFLALLMRHARDLLTYDQILNFVWGWEATDHRIVHTFAAQLRAKLGARGGEYLINEYGSGYRFSPRA
jgi:two-component system, OmpR family, KDP operon response regulator KdpE